MNVEANIFTVRPQVGDIGTASFMNVEANILTFRHRASCIFGQAFHYSPENAFYIFNQQIYFII